MSVVVYDTKRRLMIADSRAYSGSPHPMGTKMKIHRITEGPFKGALLGITSCVPGMGEEFKQWVTEGMSKEAFGPSNPDFEALLVLTDGSVIYFNDAYYPSGPLESDYFTIGSGGKYALGAIRAGADVFGAIDAAIQCDPFCGLPVVSLQLDPADTNQLSLAFPETPVAT
ncbi:hypothetical protein V1VFAS_044 [Rhizobium phage V1VFA-S]|nr:hypothetical protein V1VFAS_044 [Rhizobium phage V1VFA-S]